MKKLVLSLVLAGVASVSSAQSSNFGGFYGGVQVGVAQASTKTTDNDYWYDAVAASTTNTKAIAGIRFGQDFLSGSQIYGYLLEGSFGSVNTQKEFVPADPSYSAGSKVEALGSLRGKYGVVSDKLAVYGTAGLAFAKIKHKYNETDGSGEYFNENGKSVGYVIGLGASYALDQKSFVSVDVSQYNFGSKSHQLLNSDGTPYVDGDYKPTFSMRDRINTLNVSYNVRF